MCICKSPLIPFGMVSREVLYKPFPHPEDKPMGTSALLGVSV